MKILLDTRDLISLLERGRPCPAEEFGSLLQLHRGALVICPILVMELAAPLERGTGESSVTNTLYSLEQLPLSYSKDMQIPELELKEAIAAFKDGRAVTPIDPCVDRLDEAIPLVGPSPTQGFLNYSLPEMIFDIWRQRPDVFRKNEKPGQFLRNGFEERRSIRKKGGDLTEFAFCVSFFANFFSLDVEGLEIDDFSGWLWNQPDRCPGISLWFKVRHQVMLNSGDRLKDSDIGDLSLFWLLPYVHIATIDRRMRSYLRAALREQSDEVCARVFSSIEEVLEFLEAEASPSTPNPDGEIS